MRYKHLTELIKKDYWSLRDWQFRYEIGNFFLINFPGQLGRSLRYLLLKKYAGHIGKRCILWPGIKVRNVNRLVVGDFVMIGEDCFLQAGGILEIGDHAMIGPRTMIWTVNHIFSQTDKPIAEQGTEGLKVTIGADCWIGANVFIMPGAVLGNGCVVSAGSVVGKKKYSPNSILAGNPARKIGIRM